MTIGAADGRKMDEQRISELLKHALEDKFSEKYLVHSGKSLLYKLEVDTSGRLMPSDISNPTRGQYAFQTDLLIEPRASSIPLVVIEVKIGSYSTHDIITYSSKASRHKDIYPYLRYGFVVVGLDALSRKFLTHNQGVDFAMALPNMTSKQAELIDTIRRQICNAEKLVEVMQASRMKFSRYERTIDIS